MRFSLAESMCDPDQYIPLARAAEASGWSSFVVPDSICYPEHSDTRYPYTPDGNREFLEDRPFIEPFSLIPWMAAATTTLRFTTFVVKLPVRDPVLVAKQATSVAVLSGNRFGFGVGLSPWPEDFAATGTEWPTRGGRMDEMIEIIRGLMEGGYFSHRGKYYDIPSIKMCPVPSQPVPILVGGHSPAALRRAARLGDGWMHAGGGPEPLDGMIERLKALRREYGRERDPFEIHVISFDIFTVDGVRRLQDAGVTDVLMGVRNVYARDTMTLQEKIDAVNRFAENVIHRL